jgi:hypothetical protein
MSTYVETASTHGAHLGAPCKKCMNLAITSTDSIERALLLSYARDDD